MPDIIAPRDNNQVPGLIVADSSSATTPLVLYGDAATHALHVYIAGSTAGGSSVNIAEIDGNGVDVGTGTAQTGTMRVVTATDSTIGTLTGGAVASGATDSGNPVKVGGVYNSTAPTLTTGQRGDLQLDARGNTSTTMGSLLSLEDQTNGVGVMVRKPLSVNTYAWSNDISVAYEASSVSKASPGTLRSVHGYNSLAGAQFIQVHDASSLPADGAVPEFVITVPATSNFSIDFGEDGLYCATGIVVCNSTTGPTKTIGAANLYMTTRYI